MQEGQRERVEAGGGAGEGDRERENIPSRLLTCSAVPDMGLDPTNREIMI